MNNAVPEVESFVPVPETMTAATEVYNPPDCEPPEIDLPKDVVGIDTTSMAVGFEA